MVFRSPLGGVTSACSDQGQNKGTLIREGMFAKIVGAVVNPSSDCTHGFSFCFQLEKIY